jgi:hypothetical protein
VGAQYNFAEIIENTVVSNPYIVANRQFPWIRYPRSRTNANCLPDRGSECSQQEVPPAVENLRRHAEEGSLYDPPNLNHNCGPSTKPRGHAKETQILILSFFIHVS